MKIYQPKEGSKESVNNNQSGKKKAGRTVKIDDNRPENQEQLQLKKALKKGGRDTGENETYLPANQLLKEDEEDKRSKGPIANFQLEEEENDGEEQVLEKDNNTGIPDELKAAIERLSGFSLDKVKVYYNSKEPAKLDALAFAKGNEIYIAAGQEKYLAHEAWHLIQQKEGRVVPNKEVAGLPVNDDQGLEKEADQMGDKAMEEQANAKLDSQASLAELAPEKGTAQRRGENPYGQTGEHEGWELTAHHVIAHSKLIDSLAKLDDTQRAEVLREAIPDKLTKSMLDNVKMELEDSEEARAALQLRLVGDEDDDVTINGIRLGDIRNSFFEWQGGNQFMGPNTSIRAEPENRKDSMDTDGQYLTAMEDQDFQALLDGGAQLDEMTKAYDSMDEEEESAAPVTASPESDEMEEAYNQMQSKRQLQKNIADHLKKLLALTKNIQPKIFDESKWVEIIKLDDLYKLASKESGLKREHLLKYSFYKMKQSELGEDNKYDKIKPVAGGDFTYEGVPIPAFQSKGVLGYIPLELSKSVAQTKNEECPLAENLDKMKIKYKRSGGEYEIDTTQKGLNFKATSKGGMLQVDGFDDQIPCSALDAENKVTIKKIIFENKKLSIKSTGKSLFDYCKDMGMKISTYLPKQLYDNLSAEE